jgi:hypothetical protein
VDKRYHLGYATPDMAYRLFLLIVREVHDEMFFRKGFEVFLSEADGKSIREHTLLPSPHSD